MSDRERVPWVTRTSLHRSGRAIVASITAWVDRRTGPPAGDSDLDPRIATALSVMGARNAFEDLAADRSPQFPTVTDEDFSDQRTYEPTDIPERSDADEVLGFVLVGLAGLVALCAIYPALILWIISLARGWDALTLSPMTVGIVTVVSFVLALLADRLIAGRLALASIACLPFVAGLAAPAVAGG